MHILLTFYPFSFCGTHPSFAPLNPMVGDVMLMGGWVRHKQLSASGPLHQKEYGGHVDGFFFVPVASGTFLYVW